MRRPPLQPGILAPVPTHARWLWFRIDDPDGVSAALRRLAAQPLGDAMVVGLGATTVATVGLQLPGLRAPAPTHGSTTAVPHTPAALWCWLRGDDRGTLLHRGRALAAMLAPGFAPSSALDGFRHDGGRDLTGYEDGTENPTDDAAVAAACVGEPGGDPPGSSFVAVQRWQHDLARFDAMSTQAQDHAIGRRRSDNEELADAPASAHVKRTAQESFTPAAFVLRRSMPYVERDGAGLLFVAFGRSFDAFEAQLHRMLGLEDGITDALLQFTRPVESAYFWCPPIEGDRLALP